MNIIFKLFITYIISCLFVTNVNATIRKTNLTKSPAYSALIIDANTGKILYQNNAHQRRHPASLAKLMTIYLTFEALTHNKLKINQALNVSASAAAKPSLKLHLKQGEKITTKEAILGIIVKSANDASTVLAEALAGSEQDFAKKMTIYAKKLGMHNTVFQNATGLHHVGQYTTAIDMAKLAMALKRDFPQYYALFSTTSFNFRGKTIQTHNHVTRTYQGAHGLKTGYIAASGYNLITAAKRGQKNLVGVVIGGKSCKLRDSAMVALLNRYFEPQQNLFATKANMKFASINPSRITRPVVVKKIAVTRQVPIIRQAKLSNKTIERKRLK